MKTLRVLIILILLPSSISFAGNGDEKKDKVKEVDSTEVEKNKKSNDDFTIAVIEGEVNVIVNGEFGKYASVSLTTNRGSDIFFEFLQDGNNSFTFDLCLLKEGSYFIVLNSNDEVRIKRFQLK